MGLCKMMGLSRIDHTHGEPGLVQSGCQGYPIAASCFHDDEDGDWLQYKASESLLQVFKALTRLGKGFGLAPSRLAWKKEGRGEITISTINSNK
jgi:hypothetical protein